MKCQETIQRNLGFSGGSCMSQKTWQLFSGIQLTNVELEAELMKQQQHICNNLMHFIYTTLTASSQDCMWDSSVHHRPQYYRTGLP